jgi:aminoglycoside phosphotransferase (APT) family kinase protein
MTRPLDASTGTPLAEIAVDAELVRALIGAQHPDLADLPVSLGATGWDNLTFRLGADLAVRLPRRLAGAVLIHKEQHWLPKLAGRLTLPVPTTLRAGRPGEGYPWSWSVVPWLEGEPADLAEPDEASADVLAGFLRALHAPAPEEAPPNPYRGVPLLQRQAHVEQRMARLEASTSLITPDVRALWARALEAPVDSGPVWLHGDMHAKNVLTAGGRISAVIDWGDMCAGDPATDLASIWMLLPTPGARGRAMAAYGSITQATLLRARGWAVAFATMLADAGHIDDPRLAAMGERTFARLAEDA